MYYHISRTQRNESSSLSLISLLASDSEYEPILICRCVASSQSTGSKTIINRKAVPRSASKILDAYFPPCRSVNGKEP